MTPFIAHDGRDAEVQIQLDEGPIVSITRSQSGGNAQIEFKGDNPKLKYTFKGWLDTTDPLFEIVEQAHAAGEKVAFRLESQRKKGVDPTIAYKDIPNKSENVVGIVAAVNGVRSKEAVTEPANDKLPGGSRVRAQPREDAESTPAASPQISATDLLERLEALVDEGGLTADVLAAVAAQALLNGATTAQIHAALAGKDRRDTARPDQRPSFAREAPSWKEYNSDGRQNLGSLTITAGIGMEKFVRSQLPRADARTVRNYVDLLLAVADRVQATTYGEGFRADRGASSHSLIRGIIYDTIAEHGFTLPASNPDAVRTWVGNLGAFVRERFQIATQAAETTLSWPELYAQFGSAQQPVQGRGEPVVVPRATTPQVAPTDAHPADDDREGDVAGAYEDADVETSVEVTEVEPVTESEPVEAAETGTPVAEPEVEESKTDAQPAPATSEPVAEFYGPEVFDPEEDPFFDADGDVLEEYQLQDTTRDRFIAFNEQAGIVTDDDKRKVGKLLAWTFGKDYQRLDRIPDEFVTDFIDHYVNYGNENFIAAVNNVPEV